MKNFAVILGVAAALAEASPLDSLEHQVNNTLTNLGNGARNITHYSPNGFVKFSNELLNRIQNNRDGYLKVLYKALGKQPPVESVDKQAGPSDLSNVAMKRQFTTTYFDQSPDEMQKLASELFLDPITFVQQNMSIKVQPVTKNLENKVFGLNSTSIVRPNIIPFIHSIDPSLGWVENTQTRPILPPIDPFYNPSYDRYSGVGHGTPLYFRDVGAKFLPGVKRVVQIAYATQDALGADSFGITTVMKPTDNNNENIVSITEWEDAVNSVCAPSYQLLVGGYYDTILDAALSRGWAVNYPDHEGPMNLFAIGPQAGRFLLDSMLAYDNIKDKLGMRNNVWGMYGFSGGTPAAGWAAEMYEDYAPQLTIDGIVIGGVVADLKVIGQNVDGTLWAGFLPPALLSLMRQYPEVNASISSQLKPEYVPRLNAVKDYCLVDTIINYEFDHIAANYLKKGKSIWSDPVLNNAFDQLRLGQNAPSQRAGIRIFHGQVDEIVPESQVSTLVDRWCEQGALVEYQRVFGTHLASEWLAFSEAFDFLARSFQGYRPTRCSNSKSATLYDVVPSESNEVILNRMKGNWN